MASSHRRVHIGELASSRDARSRPARQETTGSSSARRRRSCGSGRPAANTRPGSSTGSGRNTPASPVLTACAIRRSTRSACCSRAASIGSPRSASPDAPPFGYVPATARRARRRNRRAAAADFACSDRPTNARSGCEPGLPSCDRRANGAADAQQLTLRSLESSTTIGPLAAWASSRGCGTSGT